jgi:hypothetical protein
MENVVNESPHNLWVDNTLQIDITLQRLNQIGNPAVSQ